MDLKRMRRTCAALVRDLDLALPAAPEDVTDALCRRMGERLGRPVRQVLVSLPASLTGVWAEQDDIVYLLSEKDTSAWHRLAIIGHEYWHMEAGHHAMTAAGGGMPDVVFPSLDPETIRRIVACRTYSDEPAEREAEFFASLLLARVSRWLPQQSWPVPADATEIVARLEESLGGRAK